MEDLKEKVFTAPLATIKINSITCGFMRTITFTENINRAEVQGIGALYLQQAPATGGRNTLQAEFFFISLKRPEIRAFFMRDQGFEVLRDTLIFGENSMNIYVYKKSVITKDTTGVVLASADEGELLASIDDFLPNSQTWHITDNQISGTNISGIYLKPVFSKQ